LSPAAAEALFCELTRNLEISLVKTSRRNFIAAQSRLTSKTDLRPKPSIVEALFRFAPLLAPLEPFRSRSGT
jgi:hypothetical protein